MKLSPPAEGWDAHRDKVRAQKAEWRAKRLNSLARVAAQFGVSCKLRENDQVARCWLTDRPEFAVDWMLSTGAILRPDGSKRGAGYARDVAAVAEQLRELRDE